MKKIERIAVIGLGMVGSQVRKWFKDSLGYDIDPEKQSDSWEEVSKADCFFLCLPTPYKEGGYDMSYLDETIAKIPDGKIIVIKSTVLPGTTDAFQDKYPNKTFIFNPEFLTELSAEKNFLFPDMQILGVPWQGYEYACEIMLMLPPAKVMRVVSPMDAEWIKMSRNAYYTTKVIFFNQLFDLMELNPPADFETVRSVLVEDPSIGNSHSFPFHKGGRGAGGKCLPKDIGALVDFAEEKGFEGLLKKVRELNNGYLDHYPKTYNKDNIQLKTR